MFLPELGFQAFTDFRELCEDKKAVGFRQRFLDHFVESGKLMRPPLVKSALVLEELRRMVTDLFQPGQCRENQSAPGHPVSFLESLLHILDNRLV